MLETLSRLDRDLFLALNGGAYPWLDPLMRAGSNMLVWFPLYAFFLFLLQRRWGWNGLGIGTVCIALMILAADTGSVVLFKNTVQRLRPCHAADLSGLIHMAGTECGGRFGFISSHATNHFAIAVFVAGVLQRVPRWATPVLLIWAAYVSYSRIYLGAHYPGDVLVGALYGSLIGFVFFRIFRWAHGRYAE
ncbi:MAG: phosphatase PAP2 family protein [Flavobacteriales bacterium]|nr:MAG: phosphatase PAP2 family protein [Flavobacteriales bacterium]